MAQFTRNDATKYRDDCLDPSDRIKAMMAKTPTFDNIKSALQISIRKNPNALKHEVELYVYFGSGIPMPEHLRDRLEKAIKYKYQVAFPDCRIYSIYQDDQGYVMMELNLA